MRQKTRTAIYSMSICGCIIFAAVAIVLLINAHTRNDRSDDIAENAQQTMDAEEEPREPREDGRPRRRGRRGGGFRNDHQGDVSRLLPTGDFDQMPTPEEFEEELVKRLEEYRSLPPDRRFRLNQQMYQTVQFVHTGIELMREHIGEIPADELNRIRDDFDRFADATEQTFFSGIVEQYLTDEEDATIGEFVRAMHDAQDEFLELIHNG